MTDVSDEHAKTVLELDLEDRVFTTIPREAYVTLKDHKADFKTNPSVRLINARKPDIGIVAMKILDNIVREIRQNSDLKQ